MKCQDARDQFAELLDPRNPTETTPGEAKVLVEARQHLASCPACQQDFATLRQTLAELDSLPTPASSPKLRREFYSMLERERSPAAPAPAPMHPHPRNTWWRWLAAPVGACALLAAGFLAGTHYRPDTRGEVVRNPSDETRRELADLRAKVNQLETMNQAVAAYFQPQQRPANERLEAVLKSATADNPNDRTIDALIASLALDSSPNVRLRALDALYPHADSEVVRVAVLTSLPREANPLVQVAMINFLAAAHDHDAKPALEKMSANPLTDVDVRTAASRAVAQL